MIYRKLLYVGYYPPHLERNSKAAADWLNINREDCGIDKIFSVDNFGDKSGLYWIDSGNKFFYNLGFGVSDPTSYLYDILWVGDVRSFMELSVCFRSVEGQMNYRYLVYSMPKVPSPGLVRYLMPWQFPSEEWIGYYDI